jgi:hypothetical protein
MNQIFTKILNPGPLLSQSVRGLRGQAGAYRQERVVLNEDGSVIVCWHPEPKFPFELTRPVPRTIPINSKYESTQIKYYGSHVPLFYYPINTKLRYFIGQ